MWRSGPESWEKPQTRKELFEAMWRYRRSLLAYRYDVSEYLLLKVCSAFDIPYPSTNVPQQNFKPVLKGRAAAPVSWEWKDLSVGRVIPPEDKMLLDAKRFSKIRVSQRIKNVSSSNKERQERRGGSEWGNVNERGIIATHSPETRCRAEAVMETLLQAIKQEGGTIGADPERFYPEEDADRAVGFFGDFHAISIREPCKRVKKQDSWYSSYENEPRGILTLQIDAYEWDFQKSFTDSKSHKLEERIPEVLESLFLSGLLFQRSRREGVWGNMRKEARRKRGCRQKAEENELFSDNQSKELLMYFARWRQKKELRIFLKEIIQRAAQRKMEAQSIKRFKKWYQSAKLYAESLDPIDSILHSFEEEKKDEGLDNYEDD